jgi:hypothetical protein
VSHPSIKQEIRLQLLRASDRARSGAQALDRAIEALDAGDFWDDQASEAKIELGVASDQLAQVRGMSLIAALATRELR